MKRRDKGFTLIELIVVMAIIGILAGLITVAAQTARRQALIAKTKATIASLETTLGMFQADIGLYPSQDAGTTNINLIAALSTYGANVWTGTQSVAITSANWNGPYMQFRTNELTTAGSLVDPWGVSYRYNNPGANHGTGANHISYVDIWSLGPDMITTTTDDITNWTK